RKHTLGSPDVIAQSEIGREAVRVHRHERRARVLKRPTAVHHLKTGVGSLGACREARTVAVPTRERGHPLVAARIHGAEHERSLLQVSGHGTWALHVEME